MTDGDMVLKVQAAEVYSFNQMSWFLPVPNSGSSTLKELKAYSPGMDTGIFGGVRLVKTSDKMFKRSIFFLSNYQT